MIEEIKYMTGLLRTLFTSVLSFVLMDSIFVRFSNKGFVKSLESQWEWIVFLSLLVGFFYAVKNLNL